MLKAITAWIKRLGYQFDYRAGQTMARGLLHDGWDVCEVAGLPAMCPTLMPSQAFADGFFDALRAPETSHA